MEVAADVEADAGVDAWRAAIAAVPGGMRIDGIEAHVVEGIRWISDADVPLHLLVGRGAVPKIDFETEDLIRPNLADRVVRVELLNVRGIIRGALVKADSP